MSAGRSWPYSSGPYRERVVKHWSGVAVLVIRCEQPTCGILFLAYQVLWQ